MQQWWMRQTSEQPAYEPGLHPPALLVLNPKYTSSILRCTLGPSLSYYLMSLTAGDKLHESGSPGCMVS